MMTRPPCTARSKRSRGESLSDSSSFERSTPEGSLDPADFGAIGRVRDPLELQALPDRDVLLRILDIARHAVYEFLQRVRACHLEISAAVRIGIDVDRGFL